VTLDSYSYSVIFNSLFIFLQLINELRLRLPLSEREEITSEAKKAAGLVEEDYEAKRALKVAQATVSSLQVCRETE